MYVATVVLLLLVLPLGSVAIEAARSASAVAYITLLGKWFVFWAVGVRLFIAGVRQVFQPSFTAVEIFGIHEPKTLAIVRNSDLQIYRWDLSACAACGIRHGWFLPPSSAASTTGLRDWDMSRKGGRTQNNTPP